MPTMNVNLTSALADFVEREVRIGEYRSASEMVRDALRLLRREREQDSFKLKLLQQEVARGIDQAEAGAFSTQSLDEIADAILHEPI